MVSSIGAVVNEGLMPVVGCHSGAQNYRRIWPAWALC